MRPRRILLIEGNDDDTVGGSHHSLYDLVRLLDRERFTPIVCFHRYNPFVDRIRALGVEVIVVEDARRRELAVRAVGGRFSHGLDSLRGIRWRRKLLRRERIDLMHLNNSALVGGDDWLPAAKFAGVRSVCMARSDDRITSRRVRFLARYFDRIIAVSRFMADAVAAFGVPRERIRVVYNGIDGPKLCASATRSRADVRRELGAGDGQLLVMMIGNIRRWKGQHVLLDSLSSLTAAQRARLRVVFVGAAGTDDQPYESELLAFVAKHGLQDCATFIGPRNDLADLLGAADLAVHASVTPEPFGRVLIEAMACGIPVIASRLGGPAEIVTPESGHLFDPADPRELTALLLRYLDDRGPLAILADGARRRAEDFSIAATIAGITQVYCEVLAIG